MPDFMNQNNEGFIETVFPYDTNIRIAKVGILNINSLIAKAHLFDLFISITATIFIGNIQGIPILALIATKKMNIDHCPTITFSDRSIGFPFPKTSSIVEKRKQWIAEPGLRFITRNDVRAKKRFMRSKPLAKERKKCSAIFPGYPP